MPTYLMLTTLTDQGLQTLQSHPERLREVNRDVEELGARVLHQWVSLGQFDFVNVVEAPDARDVQLEVEPLLDDIDVGDLEGATIDDYRAWKRAHTRADRFPGGESLDDAARRYARAFRQLATAERRAVLVVCHEIPIRYALNAAARSGDLDGPEHEIANAAPYLFDAA